MQCFQKDPNLRVSARKLLKHPWIMSAKRAESVVQIPSTKFEETVEKIQKWNKKWNEAVKSPTNTQKKEARSNSQIPNNRRPQNEFSTPVQRNHDSRNRNQSHTEAFISPEHCELF